MERILAELAAIREDEVKVDREIDELLLGRSNLEVKIKSVSSPMPESSAASLAEEMKTVHGRILETSSFAKRLSEKVHTLDAAQSNLRSALDRVVMQLDLTKTITHVREALGRGELKAAAEHTHRVLHETNPVENDPSYRELLELERLLTERCEALTRDAKDKRDWDTVRELSLVFPLLGGKAFRGLVEYCNVCVRRLEAELESAHLTLGSHPKGAVIQHVDIIPSILQAAAKCLKRHRSIIVRHFGPGADIRLLQQLHQQCDILITPILERFIQDREVDVWKRRVDEADARERKTDDHRRSSDAADAGGVGMGGGSGGGADGGHKGDPSPQEIDNLLEEVAFVIQEAQFFDINIRKSAKYALSLLREKGRPAIAKGIEENPVRSSAPSMSSAPSRRSMGLVNGLVQITQVNQVIQEIEDRYIRLESYSMRRNVAYAIEIDEQLGEGQFTTSMVDDVFYVLKKSTERAFSTLTVTVACTVVNHVNEAISTQLKGAIDAAIQANSGATNHITKLFSPSLHNNEQASTHLYLALNNLAVSAKHMGILKRHLEEETANITSEERERDMIQYALDELGKNAKDFQKARVQHFKALSSKVLYGIQPVLDKHFRPVSYDLTESQFAEREMSDPYVEPLVAGVQEHIVVFKTVFTEENYALLLRIWVSDFTRRIEKMANVKRFTLLGGLQFDRDVRKLLSVCSELCNKSVRDRFTRLMQMSSVLQLEKEEEIHDYYVSGWALKPHEVQAAMGLRVDFDPHKIKQIKFTASS